MTNQRERTIKIKSKEAGAIRPMQIRYYGKHDALWIESPFGGELNIHFFEGNISIAEFNGKRIELTHFEDCKVQTKITKQK
jgi:hypothetical protein